MRIKQGFKTVVAICLAIVLMGFTLPEYRDGQALVDEESHLVSNTQTELAGLYGDYLTSNGVKVITVLESTVEEKQIDDALAGMVESWQLSRSVLVLVNPETGVVSTRVTDDIQLELGDIGANIDRLSQHVEAGLVDEGLIDFYQNLPLDRITFIEAESNGGVFSSQALEAKESESIGIFSDFTLVDWLSLAIFGIVVIGGLGYAFTNQRTISALERDIRVFEEYSVQNPEYARRDIWEELLYTNKIKHSYQEYKAYMSERILKK